MSTSIEKLSESLFAVTFNSTDRILTTVTSSAAAVDVWISAVPQDTVMVGLDVEWRPNFSRGQQNPVALLQLCVGRRCLIFQILHADVPISASLFTFLSDVSLTFVGVGIKEDVERLLEDYGVGVYTMKDLRTTAESRTGKREMRQKGLKGLVEELMHVKVAKPKKVQMSRWDIKRLSLDQIKYACSDAFLSFEIGRILRAWEP